MSDVVGVALSPICFLNSCDSTRLQMVQKYVVQALPHKNCDIPTLVATDTYKLTNFSDLFIKRAIDDGFVLYSDNDIMIVHYKNLDKFEVYHIPPFLNTYSKFATKLKFKLKTNDSFKKGDILYKYEGFTDGLPTSGFNTLVAFTSFFLYNYEDAIIISESYANRARNYIYKTLYIPIYENSVLKENAHKKLLPDINDIFDEDDAVAAVGQKSKPKDLIDVLLNNEINKKRDIHDTIYTPEFNNAKVKSIKVYKLSNSSCKDKQTEEILSKKAKELEEEIKAIEKELKNYINDKKVINDIIKRFFKVKKKKNKLFKNVKDVVYLIKIDLFAEEIVLPGDKFSTRGANKGVVSIIIPDELMPKTEDGKVIDMLISPFAIPSRMNVNQIYELYVSKIVKFCEDLFLQKIDVPENLVPIGKEYDSFVFRELPLNILKDVINKFSKESKEMQLAFINSLLVDDLLFNEFLNDVKNRGLYIIVDNFKDKNVTKKDILDLYKKYEKYGLKLNEKIYFNPKALSKFLFESDLSYLPDKNISVTASVGYLHIYKLQHLARYKINARAIGPYQKILKLPTRGRAKQGGSRIGNDEINILLTYKADNILKEYSTIKADDHKHKKEFIVSFARGEGYSIKDIKSESFVKLTVSAIMKSLFCDIEK